MPGSELPDLSSAPSAAALQFLVLATMATVINSLRGVIFVFPWVLWLCFVDIAISALLLLKLLFPDTVYDLSSRLAGTAWFWIYRAFSPPPPT